MIEVVKDPSGVWRVKNCPIVSTGIEYPLASGPHTFTESELFDAVAALKDPAIVAPRIHLGHSSEYNEALIGDAEMAFGRIDSSTMVLGDNNQTIFGDYLVPEWLGMVMPIAFPNRSVEASLMVETATGKDWEMVINCVSLLGIYWPGCQVLEDLPMWYGGDIPAGVEFDDALAAKLAPQLKVAARGGGMAQETLQADADTSRIRRQFYDQAQHGGLVTPDEETDTWWWWIRGERYAEGGGMYLIVEDEDDGDLYRFDVSLSGDDVSFGDAVPVTVDYPPKATASLAAVVAGMAVIDKDLVVHASRADTGGPEPSTTKGASTMDDAKRKALAASVGLPEDATEEQIRAKLKVVRAAAEDAGEKIGDDPEVPGEGGEPKEGTHQTPPGTSPSGTAPSGAEEPVPDPADDADDDVDATTVRVDKNVWEETRAGAALARKHEDEAVTGRIDTELTAALKEGKFKPADAPKYRKILARNFEEGKEILDTLQAGQIPLEERGALGGGEDDTNLAGVGDGLPDSWFPEVSAKREAAARNPAPVVSMAKEG